ncbi:MAG: hypothetical protein KKI08_21900, partial [Armatimonadetes bacterium]|nr:hypothetical protein [Armatimonadota bacterium]
GYCKAGYTVSAALQHAKEDFIAWVDGPGGPGRWANQNGSSTPYYGWDEYATFGDGKLLDGS